MPLFEGLFSSQPLLLSGLFAPDSKFRRLEAGAALTGPSQERGEPASKKRKAVLDAAGAQQRGDAAREHAQLGLVPAEQQVKRSKKASKAADVTETGVAAKRGREAASGRLGGSLPGAAATPLQPSAKAPRGSSEGGRARLAQAASRSSAPAGEQAKPPKRRKGSPAAQLRPPAAVEEEVAQGKEGSAGLQAGGGGADSQGGGAAPGIAAKAAGVAAKRGSSAAPAAGARREPQSSPQPRKRQRTEPGALLQLPAAAGSPRAAAAAGQAAGEEAPGDAAAAEPAKPPRRTPQEEAERLRRTLFVGNLPAVIKAKRVRQTFARCAAWAALDNRPSIHGACMLCALHMPLQYYSPQI